MAQSNQLGGVNAFSRQGPKRGEQDAHFIIVISAQWSRGADAERETMRVR